MSTDGQTANALASAAYSALQRGDPTAALSACDAALLQVHGRQALAARLHAWRAQALQMTGAIPDARRALRAALATAREAGDEAGIKALQPLSASLFAQAAAARSQAPDESTLIARALAALDAGDTVSGERLARAARRQAQTDESPRDEVIALLALARIPALAEQSVQAAARVADASNDRNLVTAVAKAARASGVLLAPHVF